MSVSDSQARVFDDDAARHGGYLYTSGGRLSSRLANERLTAAALALADYRGRRVLDVGCGDGSYTVELHDRGRPSVLHGIDPAPAAIAAARQRAGGRAIEFRVGSAYDLPYGADGFDIAYLRGVLHHLERPVDALCEALRVAKRIVVVEPNGYSPILKLLERGSRYHRAHGEKSYPPHRLRQWVEDLGGEITAGHFAGLVPMFAPDPLARLAKAIEPLVEATPLLRCVGCAVYVFAATRREGKAAGKAVA